MKELERKLANPLQTPYSKGVPRFNRGGEIFMGEPGQGEQQLQKPQEGEKKPVGKIEQSKQSQQIRLNPQPVSPERQAEARRAAIKTYGDLEKLSPEQRQGAEAMIKRGLSPEVAGGAASPFDSAKFNQEADSLKSAITRQDFKNYIDLVKITPEQEMPRLYKQFDDSLRKLHEVLSEGYVKLGDSAADKIRKAEVETTMKTLDAEEKKVFELMLKKVPAEAKPASQEQVRLINEVKQGKEELSRATTDAEKEQARIKIREAAVSLYESILAGERPPEDSPVPDEIMEAIGADELATEKFMHRLIFMPIENEMHHMSGFYSQSNLDKFFKINSPEKIGKERYERLKALEDANKGFHNMNYVLKRSFDQFAQLSQSVLPEQFEVLANIPGVSSVFHLYEKFSQEHLGVETRITQKEFNKMDNEVEEFFKEINKEGIISGMEGKSLADWEVLRALTYGRNLFRISVRAAEHISHSELPGRLPGLGELPGSTEIFISPPQKELAGILNYIKFTVYRFRPNEELGGFELIDSVRKKRMEKRRKDGKMRIKTFQGTDVDMRDLENIVSARGYMYTWRMREALLREIKFKDGSRTTSITDFFEAHKNEIATISSSTPRKEVEDLFKPMLEGNQLALGVLVSGWGENVPPQVKTLIWEKIASLDPLVMSSILTRLEIDKYDKQKAKGVEDLNGVQAMEEILLEKWGTDEQKRELGGGKFQILRGELRKLNDALEKRQKEIKDMEHPFAARVKGNEKKLEKVKKSKKYLDLQKEIKQISQQYDQKKIQYAQTDEKIKELLKNEKWEALKKKLTKAHEKRILWESAHMGETPKALGDYSVGDLVLNQDEQDVYQKIKTNGEKIASDLANFSQPTTWFMDDVPLSLIKWSNMAQTYDRMVNDLGSFQKSNQALAKVIAARPFNEPPAEIAKHFGEAIAGAGEVIGRAGAAQDNYYDLIDQYLETIEEHERYRPIWISELKHTRFESTSRAQEITSSMQSPATNTEGTFDVVQHFLNENCLRGTAKTVTDNKDDNGRITYESQKEEVVRRHKIGWFNRVIKKNALDASIPSLIAFLIILFKKTFSGIKL